MDPDFVARCPVIDRELVTRKSHAIVSPNGTRVTIAPRLGDTRTRRAVQRVTVMAFGDGEGASRRLL